MGKNDEQKDGVQVTRMLQQSSVEITFDAKEGKAKQVNVKVYDEDVSAASCKAATALRQTLNELEEHGLAPKE